MSDRFMPEMVATSYTNVKPSGSYSAVTHSLCLGHNLGMNYRDFRKQNLADLVRRAGSHQKLADQVNRGLPADVKPVNGKYFYQILTGFQGPVDRKPKDMGDDVARRIEAGLNLPPYWIDQDHSRKDLSAGLPAGIPDAVPEPAAHYNTNVRPGPDVVAYYPLIGVVPGGDFKLAVEETITAPDTKWLPSSKKLPGLGFYLRVTGTSMAPTINDGDIILVDTDAQPTHRSIVVARNGEAEVTVKRLINDGGTMMLVPDNPQFAAKPLGQHEIIGVALMAQRDLT